MPSKYSGIEFLSIRITDDSSYFDNKYGITESVQELIQDIYFEVGKGKKSTIKRLECLCKKYSKVSQFWNYLSKEYMAIGHHKRAEKVNDRLLEIHPDYLFGKLNKAHQLMEQGEAEKIPELLGETLELQSLYPERPLDLNPPQQGLKLAIVKTIFSGKTLST